MQSVDAELVAESEDDLLALVLAHQPVVDEHAGEPVLDGPQDEQRRHRGIDAAGQPQTTRPSPTWARIRSTCSSMIEVRRSTGARSRRCPRGSAAARRACARSPGGTGSRRCHARRALQRRTGDAVDGASAVKPGGGRRRGLGATSSRSARAQVGEQAPGLDHRRSERPNSPTRHFDAAAERERDQRTP